jgi:hypothetical protein
VVGHEPTAIEIQGITHFAQVASDEGSGARSAAKPTIASGSAWVPAKGAAAVMEFTVITHLATIVTNSSWPNNKSGIDGSHWYQHADFKKKK